MKEETSGFAIATLITTFVFPPATYFLAYFATKEIANGQRSGRALVIISLFLLAILPILSSLGALLYFGAGAAGLGFGLVYSVVVLGGIMLINDMMKKKQFKKSTAITGIVLTALAIPVAILLIAFFGVLSPIRI